MDDVSNHWQIRVRSLTTSTKLRRSHYCITYWRLREPNWKYQPGRERLHHQLQTPPITQSRKKWSVQRIHFLQFSQLPKYFRHSKTKTSKQPKRLKPTTTINYHGRSRAHQYPDRLQSIYSIKIAFVCFLKREKRFKKHPLQTKLHPTALHTPTIPDNLIHKKSTLNKGGLRRISPNIERQSGFSPRTAASCTQKSRVLLGAVASSVEHLLNRSQKCKSSIRHPIRKQQNRTILIRLPYKFMVHLYLDHCACSSGSLLSERIK